MEYTIIKSGNLNHLEDLVNKKIREGWEPYGTFVCVSYPEKPANQMDFAQPMVIITPEQPKEKEQLND